jgi:hypothetical protein
MREKAFVSLLVITLLLVGCAGPTSPAQVGVTPGSFPSSPSVGTPTTYPEPVIVIPVVTFTYPEPGTPGIASPAIPTSGYEPQPGDSKLTRGEVFLEVENSSVVVRESFPVQVSAILSGNLPNPCYHLRVVVTPANSQNEIKLVAYSVVDPSLMCTMVIKQFSATIPLGSYAGGHFTVYANGQLIGEFDA